MVTRARELTEDLVQAYDGEDPTKLELTIQHWKEALQKYIDADNLVMADKKAERADADKDMAAAEVSFFNAQAEVIGFRREFDAPPNNAAAPQQAQGAQPAAPAQGLPKLEINTPPRIQEDCDLISWLKWKPLWTNYSNLMQLGRRPREIQVSIFWQSCSSGFLKIIQHTIGIRQDTGLRVEEIMDRITAHL